MASVSWSQIAHTAAQLATWGTNRSRVGLLVSRASHFATLYVAAIAAGMCVCPLDPRATDEELLRAAEDLAVTDVLVDDGAADRALCLGATGSAGPVTGTTVVHRSTGEPAGTMAPSPATLAADARWRGSAGGVLLRTSGTTGAPKLVPLTERQLLFAGRQVAAHHRLGPSDRGMCPLPLFHVNAQVVGVTSALVSGASLVVGRGRGADWFWDAVEGTGATWLNLVPAFLATAADRPPHADLSGHVRFARSASSPLAEPIRQRFEARTGISVLETYGMTEAAGQITANPLLLRERRPGTVGVPVGVDLRVVHDASASGFAGRDIDPPPAPVPAAPGEIGMVEIAGPSVIWSYLTAGHRGTLVPARQPSGWLRTGDLARRDRDGFVELLGRADEIINRGGEKFLPAEVEAVLLRDHRVADAAVVGRPHPSLGAEPVAFVVPRRDVVSTGQPRSPVWHRGLVEDLHRLCATALSRYKRPVSITVIGALPVGPTGKVARHRIVAELAGIGAP